MLKLQCNFLITAMILILSYSCSGRKQNHYVNQLKENLPVFDSITLALISKYSKQSITHTTTVYPSKVPKNSYYSVYDTSINLFCEQNDINYIEVKTIHDKEQKNKPDVRYFLSDNNYQYIFNNKEQPDTAIFENTRVRIVPVNNKWTFQYEKPNF